jgi:hypothetical protein
VDENEKNKLTKVVSISTNHNLKLYKNALTVHDCLAPHTAVTKPAPTDSFFQYTSPTRETSFGNNSLSNSLTTSFEIPSTAFKTIGSDSTFYESNVPSAILIPTSSVHVLFSKYNVVISVDVSPSMSVVDPDTGDIPLDSFIFFCLNVN